MRNKNYNQVLSIVVNALADKFSPEKYSEGDSNWVCNMYLNYYANYLRYDTFVECEILHIDSIEKLLNKSYNNIIHVTAAADGILDLFRGMWHCQPHLSYEQIGELVIGFLKGRYEIIP